MWGRSSKFRSIASYDEARHLYENIEPLRGRPDFRPLDRRSSRAITDIRKVGENFVIRMYSTDIVAYRPDGSIYLNRSGWPTISTAAVLSASSPFACWTQKGELIVRSASLKRFVLPRAGLVFINGEPVNPPVAVQCKTRVRKEPAKQVRAYFKDVPRLMQTFAALCAGQPVPEGIRKMRVDKVWDLEEPLDEADASALAWYYLKIEFLNTSYKVLKDQKTAIAVFWKAAYAAFDVFENYEVVLPLGEVAN